MWDKKLSASTVNVRLFAVRKLIDEARSHGFIDAEEVANLAGVPDRSRKEREWGTGSRGSRPRI